MATCFSVKIAQCIDSVLEGIATEGTKSFVNEEEIEVVNKWQDARNNKNFELADELRKVIVEKGIEL